MYDVRHSGKNINAVREITAWCHTSISKITISRGPFYTKPSLCKCCDLQMAFHTDISRLQSLMRERHAEAQYLSTQGVPVTQIHTNMLNNHRRYHTHHSPSAPRTVAQRDPLPGCHRIPDRRNLYMSEHVSLGYSRRAAQTKG